MTYQSCLQSNKVICCGRSFRLVLPVVKPANGSNTEETEEEAEDAREHIGEGPHRDPSISIEEQDRPGDGYSIDYGPSQPDRDGVAAVRERMAGISIQ
jgi:hypothetical protein